MYYFATLLHMFSHVIFYVESIESALSFFEKVFGISPKFIHESGQYAELDTGATSIALASEPLGDSNLPNGYVRSRKKEPPLGCELVFTVDDVQKFFNLAVREGGEGLSPPQEKPWGQTVAYIRDPNGVLIELASPM